jgi:hypothetical protein
MSFELALPRDVVPPMVAYELNRLGVEAADARLDGVFWTITLRDGQTLRLWYRATRTHAFWHANYRGTHYLVTSDRERDALRRALHSPSEEDSLERSA